MLPKSSAIAVMLLATGVILVVAGAALSVKGTGIAKLSFSSHSSSQVLGSTSQGQSAGSSSISAPSISPHATVAPSLSPENATYPVAGTVALSLAEAPVAGHEVDIVGSIPAKTFTDARAAHG